MSELFAGANLVVDMFFCFYTGGMLYFSTSLELDFILLSWECLVMEDGGVS